MRSGRIIVQAANAMLVVAAVFSGCTCSEKTQTVPPPAAQEAVAPPTVAPLPPTQPATQPAAGAAAQGAAGAPATAGMSCQEAVVALSNLAPDLAALATPEVRAVVNLAPDLVTCLAIRRDTDEVCSRAYPEEAGPGKACSYTQAIFRELRTNPEGRSFLIDDVTWAEWAPARVHAEKSFDALRDATRSGNPKLCEYAGDLEPICRAYLSLDKSLCRLEGDLAKVEIELPTRKEGEPDKMTPKEGFEKGCREMIETRGFLAKGLKEIAEAGSDREREFAKAALGDPGACESFVKTALANCWPPPGARPAAANPPAAGGAPAPPQQQAPSPPAVTPKAADETHSTT